MQKIKEVLVVVGVIALGVGLLGLVIFASQTPEAQAVAIAQGAGSGEVWADVGLAGWSTYVSVFDGDVGDVRPTESADAPLNGSQLIDVLGWRDKVIYLAYGRPKLHGEETWGTLGVSQTAEQSWQVLRAMAGGVGINIGRDSDGFGLNVLNPVYRSQNGVISDVYIRKALELAPQNRGVVALSFNSFADAKATIQRLEAVFPPELLAYLSVSLDVEHFPGGGTASAQAINEFSSWFAQKHATWAEGKNIPGLVIVYTFRTEGVGSISNLDSLQQYYLQEQGLVVPIFDGYGTAEVKKAKMGELVGALPNTAENPALVGVMEFRSRWGTKYDKATIAESFSTLTRAPVFFFASQ